VDIREDHEPPRLLLPFIIALLVIGTILAMYLFSANGAESTPVGARSEKEYICHVAGRADDPANFLTSHLPPQAIYGNGGHFNENGTTQAGHEQDTFGACPTVPQVTSTTMPRSVTSTPGTTTTGPAPSTTHPTTSSPSTTAPTGTGVSSTTAPPTTAGRGSVDPPAVATPAPSPALPATR
jgi:hypothetical protein